MEKPKLFDSIQQVHTYITRYVESELSGFKVPFLKYSHYEIIRLLQVHSKLSLKDISSIILRHKSTVTVLVRKLSKEGYIEQHPSKKDKRVIYINLTKKGKQFKSLVNSIEQRLLIHLHQQLSKQEQDSLIYNLNKLLPKNKITS